MEHRHIEYAVRMAPGRDQWVWTVHTPIHERGLFQAIACSPFRVPRR